MRLIRRAFATVAVLATLAGGIPVASSATIAFNYDNLGRLTTAIYDNGLCVTYSYDANGNRTAITTIATTPGSPIWGAGPWGCFFWTP